MEELETEVKDLRKENQKLRQIIENYKIEKFKSISEQQEKDITKLEKFREFAKETFFKSKDKAAKTDECSNKLIDFFNNVAK